MDMSNRSVVVGVFDDHNHAEMAVDELESMGFRDDQIGFAWQGEHGKGGDDSKTGKGLGTGAVVGGILGAAAALLIPGVGPAIAGGILAPLLGAGATAAGVAATGAAVGAAGGGLVGALSGMGVPEEEAEYYQGEFQHGRAIVTVKSGGRSADAWAVLSRHGAHDMHTRSTGSDRAA